MKQHVHLIGIGGSGLSSIARFLLENGCEVSGSDRVISPLARELERAGARILAGHAAQNVLGADIVVRSSAVPDDNPEVIAARAAGIPVLKRADFLGQIMQGKEVVAIAGTHGKTTTTAMTAWVLSHLGQDPSYIIGGVAKNFNNNAHAGKGEHFVIEADEYDNMYLGLSPDWIILTVVDFDHPDCFPTLEAYQSSFQQFIQRLSPGGSMLYNVEDATSEQLAQTLSPSHLHFSYGLTVKADFSARDITANTSGGCSFKVYKKQSDQYIGEVTLRVPGLHNVRNALAVMGLALRMGLDSKAVISALNQFMGTGRRFDVRGELNGITFVDDYAHHPVEIRTTLAAARMRYSNRRIWAVWQPHTYSRTLALLDDFKKAFTDADRVIVTEVYGARETSTQFTAAELVAHMPHPSAVYASSLQAAAQHLLNNLQPGDVVVVLSAGDADQINPHVMEQLSKQEQDHA